MAEARLVLTVIALLLAMFLAGVHGLRHRVGIWILGLLSFSWFTVDKQFEGSILIHLTRDNAITGTDLVGFLGLLVTAALWYRSGSIGHAPVAPAPPPAPAQPPPPQDRAPSS